MPQDDSRIRRQTSVRWSDADFTVRAVTAEQLLLIQRDDIAQGRRTRWSSEDALLRQVSGSQEMYLCPYVRNAGPMRTQQSYRRWLWFTMRMESEPADRPSRCMTLLDAAKELLETLPEIPQRR
jgi:hypothetical protein